MQVLLPQGWPRPRGYANGVAARGRMIFVAGMVGWDAQSRFHSDDFAGQALSFTLGGRSLTKTPVSFLDLREKLRRQVLDEVGLSVSVGLGANRMLAKIATGLAKPGRVRHS